MLVSWVQIKQRKKSFLLLKYPLKRAHFISRLCRGIRAPMRIQIYNCMKEEIYAGKWTASECDWDTGFPEFTFGSGYSAWFVSKLDVLGAEGYLPVWKAEINSRAASYALCITVERSHRQRLLHKQEGSDGVVGGDGEVSLGHGVFTNNVQCWKCIWLVSIQFCYAPISLKRPPVSVLFGTTHATILRQ